MKLYAVIREGVYTQGIVGIYDNLYFAKVDAQKAKEEERVRYRSFYIFEFTLNERNKLVNEEGWDIIPKYEKRDIKI